MRGRTRQQVSVEAVPPCAQGCQRAAFTPSGGVLCPWPSHPKPTSMKSTRVQPSGAVVLTTSLEGAASSPPAHARATRRAPRRVRADGSGTPRSCLAVATRISVAAAAALPYARAAAEECPALGVVTVMGHRRGALAVALLAAAALHYAPADASPLQANWSASEQLAPSAWRPDACQLPALRLDGPPRGADQSQAWEQRIRDVFPVFSRCGGRWAATGGADARAQAPTPRLQQAHSAHPSACFVPLLCLLPPPRSLTRGLGALARARCICC